VPPFKRAGFLVKNEAVPLLAGREALLGKRGQAVSVGFLSCS